MRKIVLLLMVLFLSVGITHAQRILINEDFESTAGMTADSLPNGWAKFKVLTPGLCTWAVWGIRDSNQLMCGTTNYCGFKTKSHPPGKRALNIPWTANSGTQTDDWCFTKSVSLLANDSLIFWMQLGTFPCGGTYYWDSCQIWVSTNQNPTGGTKTKLGTVISLPAATNFWQNIKYNLSAFAGQTVYIGFRYYMYTAVDGIMVNLDDVFVGNRSASGSTLVFPTNVCNYGTIPLYPSGVWAHGTEVLGDTLYIVGGGSAGSGSTTCQRYAINSNTFSPGTTLPESKASAPLVKAGNSLYLIGGGASVSTNGTTCWKYTPGAGWVSIAPLPTGLSGHGAVCWGDSVIFVMGGPYSSPATNVYYYRIATNTWGTSTSCLAARRTAAYGIVGNKLIIMAGYNAAFYKNVQIGTIGSNASTITWAAGPDVPGVKTGSSRPGGTGVGERFYFVPGETTPAPYPVDSIFVFNVTTNAWLPNAYTGRGAAGTASNYWDAVSSWVAGSGNVKIFIAGGALTAAFPGLWSLQVPACTITGKKE